MKESTDLRAWTACPYCEHVGLHPMRAPNPDPPVLTVPADEQDEVIERSFDGRVAVHIIPMDKYDRDDERGYETVRTCVKCRKDWGITPTRQERDDS